jgi:hypothetical protein
MTAWLAKILRSLAGNRGGGAQHVLEQARRSRARVSMEIQSRNQTLVLATIIEQVHDDEVIVAQPMIGDRTYPLAFGEQITMVVPGPTGLHLGASRCLGRTRIATPAGDVPHGGETVYGYRLAMPASLEHDARRSAPRTAIPSDKPIHVHLQAHGAMTTPIVAELVDVSLNGALVVARMAYCDLAPGQALYLKATLPDPIGDIDEVVTIARIDHDPHKERCAIGVRFSKRIDGLAGLVRPDTRRHKVA